MEKGETNGGKFGSATVRRTDKTTKRILEPFSETEQEHGKGYVRAVPYTYCVFHIPSYFE